jgi:hypothetical protein
MSDLFVEIIFWRCLVSSLISKLDSKERLIKFTCSCGGVGRGDEEVVKKI